jgi:hypothetical protein
VQLRYKDGGGKTDGTHSRTVFQIPEYDFPVLPRAQEVAVVSGPAQGLNLARMAAKFAGDAIRLDVKNDYDAIVLARVRMQL